MSGPFMSTPPPGMMDDLGAARPHRLRERVWFAMYYNVILTTVMPATIKEKVKRNLWLPLGPWELYYNLAI